MPQHLFLTTILVRDYDEAIGFYVNKLGFEVRLDNPLSPSRRWVVLAPEGSDRSCILLAKAENERQARMIGDQSGGRVFLFLSTDNFARDHKNYLERGVKFIEEPRIEEYGTVAVFEDLYRNRWDLIEYTSPSGMPA
jgi:catechol 2,3-dioxygenase-like lactoylglutathione lyase family enzyme